MENTLMTRESVKAEIDLIQEQYLEILYSNPKSFVMLPIFYSSKEIKILSTYRSSEKSIP
jgi:hypothetical protein